MPYASHTLHTLYQRRYYHRKRGNPTDPPPGFVSLSEAAERLHYSRESVRRFIVAGRFAGQVWRRGTTGRWFIREEALHGR